MFSQANTKLKKLYKYPALQQWLENGKVYSLDLLSGWSCPFAKDCHSKVVQTDDGLRIVDGPDTEFRCYSASQEAIYTNAYKKRKANFEALKGLATDEMVKLLCDNLPKNAGVIRIHAAGDFFNQKYFNAWMKVAELNPSVLFYAYTKALPYWVHFGLDRCVSTCTPWRLIRIPANVILTASRGGRSIPQRGACSLRQGLLLGRHCIRSGWVVHRGQPSSLRRHWRRSEAGSHSRDVR